MTLSPVTLEETRCYENERKFARPKSYRFMPEAMRAEQCQTFNNLNFARHYAATEEAFEATAPQERKRKYESIFANETTVDTSKFVANQPQSKSARRSVLKSSISSYERMQLPQSIKKPRENKQSLEELLGLSISTAMEFAVEPAANPQPSFHAEFLSHQSRFREVGPQTPQNVEEASSNVERPIVCAECTPFDDTELEALLRVDVQKKALQPAEVFREAVAAEKRRFSSELGKESPSNIPEPELPVEKRTTHAEALPEAQSANAPRVCGLNYTESAKQSVETEMREQPIELEENHVKFDHSLSSLGVDDFNVLLEAQNAETAKNTAGSVSLSTLSLDELRSELTDAERIVKTIERCAFVSKQQDIEVKRQRIKMREIEDEIEKRRKINGSVAKERARGVETQNFEAKEFEIRLTAEKRLHAPEKRGNYIYRVLDTVLDDVQIVARTDMSTQQTKYFRVPRVKFAELVRHGLFRGVECSLLQSDECVAQARLEGGQFK